MSKKTLGPPKKVLAAPPRIKDEVNLSVVEVTPEPVVETSAFTERASPDVAAAARELVKEMEQQRLDEIQRLKDVKKAAAEKLARLTVDMPASKHKDFKARVIQNDKNLTRLVNSWVDKYMAGEPEFL